MSVDVRTACPRCGAHVRPGAEWCTLCYTDLRPKGERVPVAAPTQPAEPAVEPVEPVAPAVAEGRGKHARRSPEPAMAEVAPVDPVSPAPADLEGTEAMLAQLAAQTRRTRVPAIASQLDSTGAKVMVMVGGFALFLLVSFVLMSLLGSML